MLVRWDPNGEVKLCVVVILEVTSLINEKTFS